MQLDPIYAISSDELAHYNNFKIVRQKLRDQGKEIPELVVQLELAGEYLVMAAIPSRANGMNYMLSG